MNTELIKKIAAGTAVVLGAVGAVLVFQNRAVLTQAEVVDETTD